MIFEKALLLKSSKEREEILLEAALNDAGVAIVRYSNKEISRRTLKIDKDTLFAGDVFSVKSVAKMLEIEMPNIPTYPDSLKSFLKRKVKISSIGELESYFIEGSGASVFIKPSEYLKKIHG